MKHIVLPQLYACINNCMPEMYLWADAGTHFLKFTPDVALPPAASPPDFFCVADESEAAGVIIAPLSLISGLLSQPSRAAGRA